jgi:hypothetical protein
MEKKKIVLCYWASSTVAVGPIRPFGSRQWRTGDHFPLPRWRRSPAKSGRPVVDDRWGMGQGSSPGQGGSNLGRREDGISLEQCYPQWCVVGRREMAWRGRPTVVGGRLSQEVVWHSRSAQDGRDEAGGGLAWADIAEVLSSGWCSLVRGERHEGRVRSALSGGRLGERTPSRWWHGGAQDGSSSS